MLTFFHMSQINTDLCKSCQHQEDISIRCKCINSIKQSETMNSKLARESLNYKFESVPEV